MRRLLIIEANTSIQDTQLKVLNRRINIIPDNKLFFKESSTECVRKFSYHWELLTALRTMAR